MGSDMGWDMGFSKCVQRWWLQAGGRSLRAVVASGEAQVFGVGHGEVRSREAPDRDDPAAHCSSAVRAVS